VPTWMTRPVVPAVRRGRQRGFRPYRRMDPLQAAGIPTGLNGAGYPKLTEYVRRLLDEAFIVVNDLLASGRFQRMISTAANPKRRPGKRHVRRR
jgi:hypothetical protein